MKKLLPDTLKELWESVGKKGFTGRKFYFEQERLLDDYRRTWRRALILKGHRDLKKSLLAELGAYLGCRDLAEIERSGMNAMITARHEWEEKVDPGNRQAVEQYYNENQDTLYELIYWHSLEWDASPLAYVTALHFIRQQRCQRCLDFGAGVGSGGILFARHGLQITLADISSPMLRFSRWRFSRRKLRGGFLDLKSRRLPRQAFDLVSAMDVFEHLFDPAKAAEELWESLKPGGFLFARFGVECDEGQPQHIVKDFGPTFERMRELGFVQVWRDEWLWGHQVFQKA